MASLRFLVVTLYCGEPDLPFCVRALSQQGVEIDHRLVSFRDEMAAHNACYEAFNEGKPGWLRAKVDADVELAPGALAMLGRQMGDNAWVTPMVHDFFTDSRLHAGVALYGPEVRFRQQTLTLKCDRDVELNASSLTSLDVAVGKHAFHATERIAFRYGYHRGMKGQTNVMRQVQAAYDRHQDRVRLMALRGFELATNGTKADLVEYGSGRAAPPLDHNYGPDFDELFRKHGLQEA